MFEKGKSGNPNGRPIGARNKATTKLIERVQAIIEDNIEQMQKDLGRMTPTERVKALIQLMQYVLPKQQSINLENQIELEYKELGILLNEANEETIAAIAGKVLELKTMEEQQ